MKEIINLILKWLVGLLFIMILGHFTELNPLHSEQIKNQQNNLNYIEDIKISSEKLN